MTRNHNANHFFLSCDWGTTSFRLKVVDAVTGKPAAVIADSEGIKKLHDQWSEYNGQLNRTDFFLSFLRKKISRLKERFPKIPEAIPVIISGMASSSIGIKELSYATLPVSLSDPKLNIEAIRPSDHFPYEIYLISGVKTEKDIMRGEETQLVGLAERYGIQSGVYILPGTHSKHVYVRNNIITDFQTYLTGELFELLISKSILANSISKPAELSSSNAFRDGIEASQNENFLQMLFKIRASDILHGSNSSENYDFLSGLLVGFEITELSKAAPEQIIVAGEEHLKNYYSSACDYMKLNYFKVDSSDDITALGHRIILNKIRNQK